jgi:hypothetical protein
METHRVALFKLYPFEVGHKIRIEDGVRQGDWEVIDVSQDKVRLRCPVSGRQFEWHLFCFFVEEREKEVWPLV